MTTNRLFQAALDDAWLTLDELCRATAQSPAWVVQRVDAGLLRAGDGDPAGWRFDFTALRRVRRLACLERDFDAVPELAALVADLEEEIDRLRRRLG